MTTFSNHFVPVLPPGERGQYSPCRSGTIAANCLDDEYGTSTGCSPTNIPAASPRYWQAAPAAAAGGACTQRRRQHHPPRATRCPHPQPYPGTAAFTPEQHAFFFGRDTPRGCVPVEQTGLPAWSAARVPASPSLVAAGIIAGAARWPRRAPTARFKPQADPAAPDGRGDRQA